MNELLPKNVQEFMSSYEAKVKTQGFKFSAPDERARLGEYAFPGDVISQILVGVATGILVDLSKRLIEWSRARMSEHKSQEDAIEEAFKSSQAVENGIELLSRQGVKTTEARAALELLKQAIAETVVEKKSGGHI